MAEKITVKAKKRDELGTGDSRRLRREGKIPVALYGGGEESLSIIAELGDLAAILRSDSGVNTIFSLDVEGFGTNDVIFHDRQIDPVKGTLIHADLRRIAKGEKLELTVPIHLTGEPKELEEGGVLTQAMREIKVLCESGKIPDFIEVDVSGLTVDQSVHVSDLKVEEGVEIHEEPEAVVASITIVKELDLEPTPEEEVEEPELIGEGEEIEEAGDETGTPGEE